VVGLGDTSVSIDVQDMLIHAKMMRGCIEEEPDVHRFTPFRPVVIRADAQ
jgi:hypothetical protein